MQRTAAQRFTALVAWLVGALYFGARAVLDFIGYTTAPEDFDAAKEKLPAFLNWLFTTPWWVPSIAMIALTVLVFWLCWPRKTTQTVPKQEATSPRYISPFAGKTQSAPETIPQRFIEVIDRDDREIAQRIRLHAIPKPLQVKRHLDAPDPYIDIIVRLWNSSVFDLEYQSAQGRFHYKNHPLQTEPESLNPGVILTRYQAEAINLRQYVTPEVARQLQEWAGCEVNITNVSLIFTYKNRLDAEKTVEFKLRGRCHLVDLA